MKRRAAAIAILALVAAAAVPARAQPENDAFDSATEIGPGPVVQSVSTSDGTTEPGEPLWCARAQDFDATIWFRYVAATTGRITVRTLQTTSSFAHLLSVYTGDELAELRPVTCRDDDSSTRGATVDLLATAGTPYMIQIAAHAKITSGMRFLVGPSTSGDIAGRVTDSASAPIAGICVRASSMTASISGMTETDADGRFTLSVPAGAHVVRFFDCRALGYTSAAVGGSDFTVLGDIVVRPAERTEGVDATLQRFGSIAGRVTTADGTPIRFVCVHRLSAEGSFTEWPVATDIDGRYVLKEVLPGSYRIKFIDCRQQARFVSEWYDDQPTWRTAVPVPVAEGVAVGGIDAQLAAVS